MGSETVAVRKYARGCEISIPLIPNICGRMRQRGTNKSPLCRQDRMNAQRFLPMLWKSIVATTGIGRNIIKQQYSRRVSVPICTTSSSGRKREIICGAKIKQMSDINPRNAIPKNIVK